MQQMGGKMTGFGRGNVQQQAWNRNPQQQQMDQQKKADIQKQISLLQDKVLHHEKELASCNSQIEDL